MWYLKYHTRRFFRSFMKPMDPLLAKKWLIRVRIIYVASGFATLSLTYSIYRKHKEIIDERNNLDTTPAHRMLRLRGESGPVKIARFSFSNGLQTYDYDHEKYVEEYDKKLKKLQEKENSENIQTAQVN